MFLNLSCLMLGYVYIDANMVEKQYSCINSVKHLPEFEEVYNDFIS